MVPMQQQQQQQQGFPMVPVMQPNMQNMMGMNFGGQMPPGAMPMQVSLCTGLDFCCCFQVVFFLVKSSFCWGEVAICIFYFEKTC